MISEENEDFENKLSQLKNQVDEMSSSVLKHVDLLRSQKTLKKEMKYKMEIFFKNNMEEFQNAISTILLRALDERFSQGDFKTQGNHVNFEEINIDPRNHDYSSLQYTHH
jgi:hypothetical protein